MFNLTTTVAVEFNWMAKISVLFSRSLSRLVELFNQSFWQSILSALNQYSTQLWLHLKRVPNAKSYQAQVKIGDGDWSFPASKMAT